MSVITRVDIIPSYAKGFSFSWEVSQALADAAPWAFTVEQAPAPTGPWTAVSPEIRGRTSWAETEPRRLSKDAVLYFRIRLKTATGTYCSEPRMPYGDLDRREFLLFSVEEDAEGTISLSTSLGISLYTTDLTTL